MKEGMEVKFHVLLTSALDEHEC